MEAEKQKRPYIHLYPEGCTTNGRAMIKFKSGAFRALRAVRPVTFKYTQFWSTNVIWTQDVVGFAKTMLVVGSYGPLMVDQDILPVFKPNAYFWKNHWDAGKEEKWEAYARVMREIMSTHIGYETSELKMEDKFAYKAELTKLAKANKKSN